MNCENFKNLILDHTVAELEQSRMNELKYHLDACSECSEFLRFADLEWRLLDKWEAVEPKADYITRFWERSNRKEEVPNASLFNLFYYRLVNNWSYMSVVSLVLVVVVATIVYVTTENSAVKYTREDREDEKLLFEVDRTISYDSADMLEIYGLWSVYNDINKGG